VHRRSLSHSGEILVGDDKAHRETLFSAQAEEPIKYRG
jgi:hypothetical protein